MLSRGYEYSYLMEMLSILLLNGNSTVRYLALEDLVMCMRMYSRFQIMHEMFSIQEIGEQ